MVHDFGGWQLASCRPRRDSGVLPARVQRPENEDSQCFQSERRWAQDPRRVNLSIWRLQVGGVPPTPYSFTRVNLFVLFRPSTDWMGPTHNGPMYVGHTLSVYWFKCQSHPKRPHRSIKNNVWPNVWGPCGPVKLTHQSNHHASYSSVCWGPGLGGGKQGTQSTDLWRHSLPGSTSTLGALLL